MMESNLLTPFNNIFRSIFNSILAFHDNFILYLEQMRSLIIRTIRTWQPVVTIRKEDNTYMNGGGSIIENNSKIVQK